MICGEPCLTAHLPTVAEAALVGRQVLSPVAVQDKLPVIPVLLPGAPNGATAPMFLGNRTWVDLRPALTPEALDRLLWGITGKKRGTP